MSKSPEGSRTTFLENKERGTFLIAGSVIAFLGFIIPGLYAVDYNPPANFKPQNIDFNSLKDFNGPFISTNGGVYNGFSGPIDLHLTLLAILIAFGLGLIAPSINLDSSAAFIKYIYKPVTISAQLLFLVQLIWAFRSRMVPSEITQKFVTDLSGKEYAINASHYLGASLGLGMLIMVLGFLVGFIGITPRVGCFLLIGSIILFIVLLIITRLVTGEW